MSTAPSFTRRRFRSRYRSFALLTESASPQSGAPPSFGPEVDAQVEEYLHNIATWSRFFGQLELRIGEVLWGVGCTVLIRRHVERLFYQRESGTYSTSRMARRFRSTLYDTSPNLP